MMQIRFIALVTVVSVGMGSRLSAQGGPCLSQPDSVAAFLVATRHVYEHSDSTALASLGIPWATEARVQVVADSAVCAAGLTAFNLLVGTAGTAQAEVSAYIYSLNGAGYAFIRPRDGTDYGAHPVYFFSMSWVYKGTIES